MKILRFKLFSSKSKKMTDKEFEEKEKNITSEYKKGVLHGAVAGVNGILAGKSIKEAVKTKGKSKLNLALAALTTGNTIGHAYKSGKHVKKAYNTTFDDKRYVEKLGEELDKEWLKPETKSFSRHTPKNLKKYKDYDLENMTRGQRLGALEEEDDTAAKNTNKYVAKKIKKHAGIGAGVGAIGGAILGATGGAKGAKMSSALMVGTTLGLSGAGLGIATGSARGQHIAKKEGHDRDNRTKRLARKMDEVARKKGQEDDYEYRNNDRIRMRKSEEAARRAEHEARMANYNAMGARYGW